MNKKLSTKSVSKKYKNEKILKIVLSDSRRMFKRYSKESELIVDFHHLSNTSNVLKVTRIS